MKSLLSRSLRFLSSLVAVAFFLCFFYGSSPMALAGTSVSGKAAVASVISYTPQVWVQSAKGKQELALKSLLAVSDVLVSSAVGKAQILFDDDTVVSMGPNSSIALSDFAFGDQPAKFKLHVLQGVSRVVTGKVVKENNKAFSVTTPHATMGIRGTIGTIIVGANTTTFVLNHISGAEVVITNTSTGQHSSVRDVGMAVLVTPQGTTSRMATPNELSLGQQAVRTSTTSRQTASTGSAASGKASAGKTDSSTQGASKAPAKTGENAPSGTAKAGSPASSPAQVAVAALGTANQPAVGGAGDMNGTSPAVTPDRGRGTELAQLPKIPPLAAPSQPTAPPAVAPDPTPPVVDPKPTPPVVDPKPTPPVVDPKPIPPVDPLPPVVDPTPPVVDPKPIPPVDPLPPVVDPLPPVVEPDPIPPVDPLPPVIDPLPPFVDPLPPLPYPVDKIAGRFDGTLLLPSGSQAGTFGFSVNVGTGSISDANMNVNFSGGLGKLTQGTGQIAPSRDFDISWLPNSRNSSGSLNGSFHNDGQSGDVKKWEILPGGGTPVGGTGAFDKLGPK